ncbi:hypothetical protein Taro_012833 [Colocasia esculenta]|uniref:Bidirectional sugar transporter SWEET n=1 Tax=Colocasia esculenta TaxID=4460 RepID=A0A843UDW8_COLES|nr:hypothetical protein [Colocasia esculenta]
MVDADGARNIVGIIGNIISFGLFLSPVLQGCAIPSLIMGRRPTFFKICKTKEVGDYSPIPYLATLVNCTMWVFYGLPFVTPDSLLVITINSCGLAFEATYLIIFVIYATPAGRRKVFLVLAGEIVFLAVVAVGVLLGTHVHKKRSLIVGVLCVIFGTCMYAAPLAAMVSYVPGSSYNVPFIIPACTWLPTATAPHYMPLPLSLASFLNGVAWTTYALIRFDIFITIPNGLGTLLAVVQLVLYCCYCGNTSKGEPCRSEVRLSATTTGNGNRTSARNGDDRGRTTAPAV